MPERSVLFVDGNNWYHALRNAGLTNLGRLNYAKVSQKLVQGREWVSTRYYIGQVKQKDNTDLYSAQRSYLSWLQSRDPRISIHFGRLEPREIKNSAATELKHYLGNLKIRIDTGVYRELIALASRHEFTRVQVEKAVDVMIAVDMVQMAINDEYDTAYLLSADGDYTPAIEAISENKKVFAAAASPGAQLASVVHTFIPLEINWFNDCFGE
jgi:uncharacterized LabA/DUF88 family protein